MVLSFTENIFTLSPVHSLFAPKVKLMISLVTMTDENEFHSVTSQILNKAFMVLSIEVKSDTKVMKTVGPRSPVSDSKQDYLCHYSNK